MDRTSRAPWTSAAAALCLLACSGASRGKPSATVDVTEKPSPADDASGERYSWPATTHSPQPLDDEAAARSPCGASDRALLRVAERIAAREAAGKPALDTAQIAFALRSEGAPYVWPRAWTLEGIIDERVERAKLGEWLGSLDDDGDARCAVATVQKDGGRRTLALVAARVLADLEPLPTRVPVGTWLDLRAVLLVPATRAEVVVLGPRGRPHAVLASLSGAKLRTRFRADREGTWLVQILATTARGPRVAAEALVAAGSAPPETFDSGVAPGEALAHSPSDPADALLAMVNGARASENLPALRREHALDRLAAEQAAAIRERRTLSHTATGRSLDDRLEAVNVRSAGENVAHAGDLARAHRSLWKSPSHRENLLHPAFELVGIGVAPDDDGSVWVCEIFASPNPRN